MPQVEPDDEDYGWNEDGRDWEGNYLEQTYEQNYDPQYGV